MVKYKAIKLSKHCVITKNNEICTDREIQTKNSFNYLSEAQEKCDELNKLENEDEENNS